jgi:hypothetical protein
MAIVGRDEEVAFFARRCPDRRRVGIDEGSEIFDRTALAEPCSPDTASSG